MLAVFITSDWPDQCLAHDLLKVNYWDLANIWPQSSVTQLAQPWHVLTVVCRTENIKTLLLCCQSTINTSTASESGSGQDTSFATCGLALKQNNFCNFCTAWSMSFLNKDKYLCGYDTKWSKCLAILYYDSLFHFQSCLLFLISSNIVFPKYIWNNQQHVCQLL